MDKKQDLIKCEVCGTILHGGTVGTACSWKICKECMCNSDCDDTCEKHCDCLNKCYECGDDLNDEQTFEAEMQLCDNCEINNEYESLSEYKDEIDDFKDKVGKLEKIIKKLEKELESSNQCDKCSVNVQRCNICKKYNCSKCGEICEHCDILYCKSHLEPCQSMADGWHYGCSLCKREKGHCKGFIYGYCEDKCKCDLCENIICKDCSENINCRDCTIKQGEKFKMFENDYRVYYCKNEPDYGTSEETENRYMPCYSYKLCNKCGCKCSNCNAELCSEACIIKEECIDCGKNHRIVCANCRLSFDKNSYCKRYVCDDCFPLHVNNCDTCYKIEYPIICIICSARYIFLSNEYKICSNTTEIMYCHDCTDEHIKTCKQCYNKVYSYKCMHCCLRFKKRTLVRCGQCESDVCRECVIGNCIICMLNGEYTGSIVCANCDYGEGDGCIWHISEVDNEMMDNVDSKTYKIIKKQ